MVRRLSLSLSFVLLFLLAFPPASGQDCTTTVLVSFYDQLTTAEIQTLNAADIEARMSGSALPVLDANRNFSNRLVILLETEGAAKSEKLEELINTVTRQARTAPEGKPVALGIFAQKAMFTKFIDDPEKRNAAVGALVEEEASLGKRAALWDALHEAIAQFGPHQPGDTILLIGDPYDDASHRSASDVEKEFIATGTRLFMMRRAHASRVDRDFMWNSHELEKTTLDRLTQETGGLLSEYVPSLIRFAWAGYLLQVKPPAGMEHPRKWKVQFRGSARDAHRKTNFYYPAVLPPCSVDQAKTEGAKQASR
jgi:hypothetical protein